MHARLVSLNLLNELSDHAFATEAARIIGDVNYVHPFREGNGRAQLQYLQQLALQAGHPLDLAVFQQKEWITASRAFHQGDYSLMTSEILRAITTLR